MRTATLEAKAHFEVSEPASRHGAQLEGPYLGPFPISSPFPRLEIQMEQRQCQKQQIATVDRSQGQVKSQIVAQARMEALRESARRRKSLPAASGSVTGMIIPMPVDRNLFKKTSELLGECPTASNESGRKIVERVSEVSVPIFPKHLNPGGNTVRRRKEDEKNFLDSKPSESSGFSSYASTLPNEKKEKTPGFRPSSSFIPSSNSIKPGGQKPNVKSSRLNKKRTLDETDSKASPHKDKKANHVASDGLETGPANENGNVMSKIANKKKSKSVDRRASAPGSFDWAAWGKG